MASEGLLTHSQKISAQLHTHTQIIKKEERKKLSDKWASFPLKGQNASQFACPLGSPSPFSSIKNKIY